MGFFEKLKNGLSKTRNNLIDKIKHTLNTKSKIDDDLIDEIEEILFTSDLGSNATTKIIDNLRDRIKKEKYEHTDEVFRVLKEELSTLLETDDFDNVINPVIKEKPYVLVVVGVNGAGKTTTIGKLSNIYRERGLKVLVIAADTFRAAAVEQLERWATRANVDIISQKQGADPAAVVYDGLTSALHREYDIVLIDTAGRLHTKSNLMEELNKIQRVIKKLIPRGQDETILVLDGTVGQNGIVQAKVFREFIDVSGIVITKLDGTAKGGAIVGIKDELGIPIHMIGVGEKIEDLQRFVPTEFVNALFEIEK
jgi:fused signal recognition particle receptor